MADTEPAGVKLIERRFPGNDAKNAEWTFFEQSYKGGAEYILSNLFKYFKEGDKEYQDRVKRCYRKNRSKRAVDLVNCYLFKGTVKRNTNNKNINAFHKNIDGKNNPITRLMKAASL
ncbi:MAG: hypothetical protein GY874_23615 [Desulfobacteraceae bacterium]|nr:hypothetical protein [Desulfobacteraceae bacterium]